MVVSAAASNFFCLFFLFTAVTADVNSTSYSFNATASDDHNVTDTYTTQPTAFEPTSPTPSDSSTEEPVLPGEPLPESGRLLTPVTAVDSLCPCDEHKDVCDINCCCDRECSEDVALFTSCSVQAVRQVSHLVQRGNTES
uniref:Tectonic-1-3 N-terminal domain-containing protein n=1 Tax=Stegastes partitus TaxID=144197 RepID=A0A3B5ASQ9_9TELE